MLSSTAQEEQSEEHGIQVGQEAPDFTLKDSDGTARTLESFLKKGTTVLVFYRSADW